jgi:hypothetical protein
MWRPGSPGIALNAIPLPPGVERYLIIQVFQYTVERTQEDGPLAVIATPIPTTIPSFRASHAMHTTRQLPIAIIAVFRIMYTTAPTAIRVTRQAGRTRKMIPMDKRRYPEMLPTTRMLLTVAVVIALAWQVRAETDRLEAGFRVKHVYAGAVYLEAGSSAGIAEGQRFLIRRKVPTAGAGEAVVIAEIEIESVAPTSAAGRIVSSRSDIVPGDMAYLSQKSLQEVRQQQSAREIQKYPQIAGFTDGIPPEQEMRENIPKPPLPEVNRIRGRIGTDFNALQISGSGTTSQYGFMLRLDATQLAGSHWNISGYYRGKVQSRRSATEQETLTDLINRTYHLSLNYDNPASRWVAGGGRLYVPWASSLSTIDGFYLGRRFAKETVGFFAGTTPDPTSWNYDPHRQLGGVFVNFDHGSFDSFRINSTSGIALSRIHWKPDRQFGFFENGIFYKHYLSIYSNLEVDLLTGSQNEGKREIALSRSYFTIRLQPNKIISFDVNENYFRNIPTFDTRLIGTGLLDKFLFQGLSGGFRLALPFRVGIYANTGRSSRTGDYRPSWNYLAGASIGNMLHTGIRAEYRYSRFDSSFGSGNYQSLSISPEFGEGLRFEVQAGKQSVSSAFTSQNRARFINGNLDWYLGDHYFLEGGLTFYRGALQDYNQYLLTLGYRFDNHKRRRE